MYQGKSAISTQWCLFGLFLFVISASAAISRDEELILSQAEKNALDKFKEIIIPQIPKGMEWMKHELVLIRVLRGTTELDVELAEKKILDIIKWRQTERMDKILQEDFSDMFEKLPYYLDTKDREGRPIWSISIGEWNFQTLSDNPKRVYRYMDAAFESMRVQVQKSQDQGQNVTQAVILINIKNFHLILTDECHQCIVVILEYFSYQVYFPFFWHKVILVNTPVTFEIVMRLLRLTLAPQTKEALEIYGTEKRRWKKYLLSLIDSGQLYQEFGGTKFH